MNIIVSELDVHCVIAREIYEDRGVVLVTFDEESGRASSEVAEIIYDSPGFDLPIDDPCLH